MEPQTDTLYDDFSKGLYRIVGGSPSSASVMDQLLNDPNANLGGSVNWPAEQLGSGVDTSTTITTTGSMQAGKKTFDNTVAGFIIGVDPKTGTAKFYIGNTTNYVNWDGTTLTITGTINALSGYFGSATNGVLVNANGIQLVGTGYIETDASPNERIVIQHSGTYGNDIEAFDSTNFNTWDFGATGDPMLRMFGKGSDFMRLFTSTGSGTGSGILIQDSVTASSGFKWQGPTSGSNSASRQSVGAFHFLNQNCAHGEGVYLKNSDSTWDGNFIRALGTTTKNTNLLRMDETGWSAVRLARITGEGHLNFPAFRHRSEFDEGNAAIAAAVISNAYWVGSGTAGTQTLNPGTFSSDGWTYVELSTTGAANSTSIITFRNFLQTLNETVLEAMVKFSSSTNTKWEFGWKYDANNYILWRFDTAVHASNIYLVWNTGGGETTQATGASMDTGSFHIYRMAIYPGPVVYIETDGNQLTAGSPSLPSLAKPYFYIDNKAVAATKLMEIDYVDIFTGRNMTP